MKAKISEDELNKLFVLNKLNDEKIDWYSLCKEYQFSKETLEKYNDEIFKGGIVDYKGTKNNKYNSNMNTLLEVIYYVDFSADGRINVQVLGTYIMYIRMSDSDLEKIISIDRLRKHDIIDLICSWQMFSEDFIERHADILNWKLISSNQVLSEEFIEKHQYEIYWYEICRCQDLSNEFIMRNIDKFSVEQLMLFQPLPEQTIEMLNEKNSTCWDIITSRQQLSEEFIEKHQYEINFNWKNIVRYQNVSKEFLDKHRIDIMQAKSLKDGYKKRRDF